MNRSLKMCQLVLPTLSDLVSLDDVIWILTRLDHSIIAYE